ncbi:MAG TPA: carbon-nitrogen hydrolase [Acidobacteriaceae bacterium]|jgi:N-carbamoylputrescine amidase|nr:carbon-nitrogen hydrolase [Acidobacteriaceae bacterium]
MSAEPVRVALIQMACVASVADNLDHATEMVRQAARDGAQIVCLPELFRSQYFCQHEDHRLFALAESIPGPSTARLSAVVREARITLIASLFERRAPGVYHNTVAVLDHTAEAPDQISGLYRKMHIPDDPLFYEKFYFAPGDLGFRAIPTSHGPIGALICWDQWFPEAARLTALEGAEMLFYPTAIGWHPSEKAEFGTAQYSAWKTIQRAHAIANGVFVCAVNRVGHEHGDVVMDGMELQGPGDHTPDGGCNSGIDFWGGSFICDPFGRILAQASHDKEEILTATLDPTLVETTRQHWPFLRDRRIDAYAPITRRLRD